jgi:hypothetical protein
MLPSIMALAFPIENPVLSRTGGALVPILLIAAIGLQSLLTTMWKKGWQLPRKRRARRPGAITGRPLSQSELRPGVHTVQNRLRKLHLEYLSDWQVCKDFIDSVGSPDSCFVSGLGYWVDTRLVAMTAGYPDKDFALWPKDYGLVKDDPRAMMFIVRPDQTQDLATLHQMFPAGFEVYHTADIHDHDFITFLSLPGQSDLNKNKTGFAFL